MWTRRSWGVLRLLWILGLLGLLGLFLFIGHLKSLLFAQLDGLLYVSPPDGRNSERRQKTFVLCSEFPRIFGDEVVVEMKADEVGLTRLRSLLVASARKQGLHPNDVEDVVQQALLKIWRESPRPGAPAIEIRAQRALRDIRIEFYRQRSRRQGEYSAPEPGEDSRARSLPEELVYEERAYQLIELNDLVTRILPPDARTYAFLKMLKATEADIARLMGWSEKRAAAARVQLGRKKAEIVRAVLNALTTGEED